MLEMVWYFEIYYTIVQKFGVGKGLFLLFVLLKEVSYAHQDCIYLIKNTVQTLILEN